MEKNPTVIPTNERIQLKGGKKVFTKQKSVMEKPEVSTDKDSHYSDQKPFIIPNTMNISDNESNNISRGDEN